MTAAEPVENENDALVFLRNAALKARELQRELDRIVPRATSHSFRVLRWGVTVPTGNYSSARVDAEVFVDADQDPVEVLAQLKSWVGQQAPVSELEYREMIDRAQAMRQELTSLEALIITAKNRWDRIVHVFEAAGMEVPQAWGEDLPF
jgi:hypothetical protein